MAQSLVYNSATPGSSSNTLLVSHPIPSCSASAVDPASTSPSDAGQDEVLVRFLAAPVNRVDLMLLAGRYPIKPKYTAPSPDGGSHPIPGFDGCAIVQTSATPDFQPGDLVLPRDLGLGTWRTHAALPASALIKLPAGIDPVDAALIRSGALIARLLLDEVTPLRAGDWVIASAGTSGVSQFLVQLARQRGVRVVLVVRDREEVVLAVVKAELRALGAYAVLSESELEAELAARSSKTPSATTGLLPKEPISLALDSVFGRVGQLLASALAPGGKFVLVGLLAGPSATVTVTTDHLFTRQLSFLPFRGSEHLKRMGSERAEQLIYETANMFIDGTLKRPTVNVVDWTTAGEGEVEEALKSAVQLASGKEVGHIKTVWKLN
jgi:trans-2-enoyl-CoA reductase